MTILRECTLDLADVKCGIDRRAEIDEEICPVATMRLSSVSRDERYYWWARID